MSDNLIGATTAIFIVSLSIAVAEPVDVAWSTRDGTAKASTDYQAASGVVTFLPGETEKQIEVIVYGQNVSPTGDKNFFINLMPPTNAVLGTALIEAVIKVEDESGVPVTSVIVAQGKRGLKGDPGLSAYEQAVLMGYDGTLEDWMQEQADAAAAAQRASDYAANAAAAATKAENAATAASFLGNIFPTPEAGVDPVTGVQNGAYYNVRSTEDDSYLVEYQNIGGVPTPSGKAYPSSMYVQQVSEKVDAVNEAVLSHVALSFDANKAYEIGERVQLENGEQVKSQIPSNTANPNFDMTGWVDVNNVLSSVKDLAWVFKIAGISFFVKSYRPEIGLGGGHFVWDVFGDKAKHNGGTIIDPDRPFPSDWSNNTQVTDWFTAGVGTGVWRRIYSGEVNAEVFGFISNDTHDSQLIVQHIVDKVSSSNIPVTFRNGVALISKAGITVKTGLDVTLDNFKFKAMSGYETYDCVFKFAGCEKANIYFKGDSVVEMPQDEYTTGEWRHAFNFNGGSNIEVFYPKVNGTGGDAYYIANNTNIKLHKPVSLRSRRQGMSVISVDGLRVYNPEFHNTIGTTPQAGICIEPGNALGVLKDIVIESPVCNNNGGCGITIYLEKLSASTYSGEPIEITINNPVTKGNAERGILIERVYNDTVKYGGYININNPLSRNDKQGGIHISGKDKDCAVVNITNPVIVDACANGTNYATKSAVLITDFAAIPVNTGGINITDIVTTDKYSKVDFAVNFDLANGISDSTVTLASWKGATTAPIGFGSSTEVDPAKAELSTIVFKTTKELTDKAYTSGFNTTKDSYSNVITNSGSGFDIAINLRWYPPKSLPLKFAVKAEKRMTIKPLDITDKIIGTSVAGKGIYSDIVGATAEIYYFGLINGVRLWRFVGDRDLWTFE